MSDTPNPTKDNDTSSFEFVEHDKPQEKDEGGDTDTIMATGEELAVEISVETIVEPKDDNVTLISSDGVEFKVSAKALSDASPIFRALLTLNQFNSDGATITFNDEKIETGSVIGLALHYIDKRQVDDNRGPIRMVSVLKFSGKWHFACIPKLVQEWIQTLADQSQTPERAFLSSPIAMLLGFPALSSQLYDTGKTRDENRRGKEEEDLAELEGWLKEYRDAIPGRNECRTVAAHKFAPLGDLSYAYFSALPPRWLLCLLLSKGVERCDFGKADFKAIAAQMYPPLHIPQ